MRGGFGLLQVPTGTRPAWELEGVGQQQHCVAALFTAYAVIPVAELTGRAGALA